VRLARPPVVPLARTILIQEGITGSIVTVVRDVLRPGIFRCIDDWHRCLAGDLLEQTGSLTYWHGEKDDDSSEEEEW